MQRPALLVLVRHAESQRNAAKLNRIYLTDEDEHQAIRGIPDYKVPLTDKGVMQAKEAGERIRDRYGEFDYAYHSGYLRTMETLEHILEAYPQDERDDIQIRMNPFIRERDPGYTYDMTEEQAKDAFPWLEDHWKTFGGYFARPPGGESLDEVSSRVYNFLNMLFRDRAN